MRSRGRKNKNIRRIISILVILLIVIAIVFGIIKFLNRNKTYEIQEEIEYNYLLLNNNNKYGVLNSDGNKIIEDKYDLVQIPNPELPIFICHTKAENGEVNTEVFNDKNEKILEGFNKVQAIETRDTVSPWTLLTDYLTYEEDGKVGLINTKGKKITKPIYESIECLAYKNNVLLVKKDGKYGIIDYKGKKVIDTNYDNITSDKYYNDETKYENTGFILTTRNDDGYRYGYANAKGRILLKDEYTEINRIIEIDDKDVYTIVSKEGQIGMMKNSKVVVDFAYKSIEYNVTNNLISVQQDIACGVIDMEGNIIVPIEYDNILFAGMYINAEKALEVTKFTAKGEKLENTDYISVMPTSNEDYKVTVNAEEKFGIINKNDELVLANVYNYIEYAFDNYFMASINGKVGVIDDKGNVIVDFQYDVIQKLQNTKILQAMTTSTGKVDIYNASIKKVSSVEKAYMYETDKYIKLYSASVLQYYDHDGNPMAASEIFKNNKLFAKEVDGKWGFADVKGEIVLPCKYDMVTEFNNKGYAGYRIGKKWGIINQEGKIIKDAVYDIDWLEPEFLGEYYKVYYGYGQPYYTNQVNDNNNNQNKN